MKDVRTFISNFFHRACAEDMFRVFEFVFELLHLLFPFLLPSCLSLLKLERSRQETCETFATLSRHVAVFASAANTIGTAVNRTPHICDKRMWGMRSGTAPWFSFGLAGVQPRVTRSLQNTQKGLFQE